MRRDVVIHVPPAMATTSRRGAREPVRKGDLWVFEDGASTPIIEGGAVTAHWYRGFFKANLAKDVDMDAASELKCMLLTNVTAPNQDTHEFKSSITTEVTGTGYTATGNVMTSVTQDTATTLVWAWDAADVSWATSTITARYAVIYDAAPATDATRRLISYVDFGADVSSTGGTFLLTWAAGGIGKVTVS